VSGFRKFLMRGNLVDMAVAVVIGVAFNAVVQALISGLITPLITAITGQKTYFASLSFDLHHSKFVYGGFVNALISFVVIAAVVYYLLVAPANRLTAMAQRNKQATDRQCPECLNQIPIAARRCMYCTSEVPAFEPPSPPPASPRRRHRHGSLAAD
jgi:large conductance mechanosensitive channel